MIERHIKGGQNTIAYEQLGLSMDIETKVVQHDNYHDDYYDYHDNYHDDYHNENLDYRDDYHDA